MIGNIDYSISISEIAYDDKKKRKTEVKPSPSSRVANKSNLNDSAVSKYVNLPSVQFVPSSARDVNSVQYFQSSAYNILSSKETYSSNDQRPIYTV